MEVPRVTEGLAEVNEIDSVENREIRQIAEGIIMDRPWVWLRPVRRDGKLTYVPHISVNGAFELFRRLAKTSRLSIVYLSSGFMGSKQGIPVVSVLVGVNGVDGDNVHMAIGGQDAFLTVEGAEDEEVRAHGTAQALHKAMRNAIVNYVLLYHGEEMLAQFVQEAIMKGKAAIIERGGRIVSLPVSGGMEDADSEGKAEKKDVAEGSEGKEGKAPVVPPEAPTGELEKLIEELEEVSPNLWGDYLLVYAELVSKDPSMFGSEDWKDFVRWCRTKVTQAEIDDLLRLVQEYVQRKEGVEVEDRRELFRYLFNYMKNCHFIRKNRRITDLVQPEYRLLRQKLVSELMEQLNEPRKDVTTEEESDDAFDYPF